ncbi:MAG TPA: hypothetical protein DEQ34_07610 [Balneolaceae bacterium]|nr:hypothetical protein [Balneolaceae bacterium]|tara:strand:- start:114831 stop:115037 length:207 start_codon:yes stop_codon:yes gene_type:complete
MSIKEQTVRELKTKVEEIEDFIAENGVGSRYLSKAEKMQRDLNIGLVLGGATIVAGAAAWALLGRNNG